MFGFYLIILYYILNKTHIFYSRNFNTYEKQKPFILHCLVFNKHDGNI